jgi:dynein heavy chain
MLIFENSDSLNILTEFPNQFKSKLICFIKRNKSIINKDIPLKKQLTIAEFTQSSITQLSLFISEILWPILQRKQIISDWPDIINRSCLQNLSELTNLLTIINGILRGRTVLPIPHEIQFLSRSDYVHFSNSNKIRLLENLLITWKNQIQTAINYNHDLSKTNSYLLPNIEIEFWIKRAENLQGIKTQVCELFLIDYKQIIN